MPTTTKKDLIDRIAEETKYKRGDVRTVVQAFLQGIIEELGNGNRLEFRNFGVFELRDRAPRMAQNPKTLERVPVQAKRIVKFKIGRLMKDAVDMGLSKTTSDGSPSKPKELPVVETKKREYANSKP